MHLDAVVGALCLAAVHLFASRLRFLDRIPRSRWLSIAGGIAVAYVVVHLLPELAQYQAAVSETSVLASAERHLYVVALAGLAVFYGVERWSRSASTTGRRRAAATAFVLGSYALYNALVGYLLARRGEGTVLFCIAMGLHFVVNDHGLRHDHPETYRRHGRWLLSAAVVGGAAAGMWLAVHEALVGVVLALIAGGTILNVMKEELPAERESRFGAFALGALGYTAVLLAA